MAAAPLGGPEGLARLLGLLCVVCCFPPGALSQLTVTSLPEALFLTNDGVRNVVEGTVIQLYCVVQSPNVTFSWTKDGEAVILDVPRLRERTCSNSTASTSMLTIETFQFSDNGTYQCSATFGDSIATGSSTTLTAINSSADGVLQIMMSPQDNEKTFERDTSMLMFFEIDSRSGIVEGQSTMVNGEQLLVCEVTYIGTSSSVPTFQWIKNGEIINKDVNSNADESAIDMTSTLVISNFGQSEVGVYQCIVTDDDTDAEVIMTQPYRLDTDIQTSSGSSQVSTVFLEAISPRVIFLRPPERLVIEVKATGRVLAVRWQRNGVSISSSDLFNHDEIYVQEETNTADVALYEVRIFEFSQLRIPNELTFHVISPVDANTTASNRSAVVSVLEGSPFILSCTSTGAPVPSIEWEFNNQSLPIIPSESVMESNAELVRNASGDLVPDVTIGRITSSIEIVAARYPDDQGNYICIGSNDNEMLVTSEDTIVVQVTVPPEVEVSASRPRINIGGSTTLSCNVMRTNPEITGTFVWERVETGEVLSENSDTLMLTISSESDFGNYSCTVTNTAGLSGNGTVAIGQGFPPVVSTVQPLPVVVNTTVVLVCAVSGLDPPDRISWYFNSVVVFTGNATTGGDFTQFFTIDDYGAYTCSSSNEFGTTNSTIQVIQAVAPFLSPDNVDVEVEVGTRLTLAVNVTEFNLNIDNVTWTQNETVIENGTDGFTIEFISLNEPPSMIVLTLEEVTSPVSDGGLFTVSVSNPAGLDMSTFNVTVSASPMITDPSEDTNVTVLEQRDDIELNCTAFGVPAPAITWYRAGVRLIGSEGRVTISNGLVTPDAEGFLFVSSTLTVSPSDRRDSDRYSCQAENVVLGAPATATRLFNVTVNFAVTIYENPADVSVLSPEQVVLTCQADGEPVPDIIWFKDIVNGSSTLVDESSSNNETVDGLNKTSVLIIRPTSALDTASYTCRAQNNVGGMNSTSAQVTVYVAPSIDSPQNGTTFRVNVTNDAVITCTASAVPPPDIDFYFNGTLLTRTGGETGIGEEVPMRVQVSDPSAPMMMADATYQVSRSLTLFNVRDELLTGFECRARNNITELSLTPSASSSFDILVQVPPMITTAPENITVVSPDNATLSCVADGVPAPSIVWTRRDPEGMLIEIPSEVIDGPDNMTIISIATGSVGDRTTESTISFFLTQQPFAAEYTCRASNLLGAVQQVGVLTVHVVPVILEPDENVIITVDEFTSATFFCSAAGIPTPTISWFRIFENGTTQPLTTAGDNRVNVSRPEVEHGVDVENRGFVTQVNRTLTLMDAVDDDSGRYRCVAINQAGNTTQDFQLVVQVAPMSLISPMNQIIIEGEDALFTCLVSGRPRPTIVWVYQDSPLTMYNTTVSPLNPSIDYVIVTDTFGDREIESNLTVIMTLPSDAGFYTCVADNDVEGGVSIQNAFLSVQVVPEILEVYSQPGQTSYVVNETESITFDCSATGVPEPVISWFRDGEELSGDRVLINNATSEDYMRTSDRETVRRVNRTLVLANAIDADSGMYMCNATNDAGRADRPFELVVQIAPTITVLEPPDLTVTMPTPATFTCNATGRPRPIIQWYRMDPSGDFVQLFNGGSVMITDTSSGMREITSVLNITTTSPSDATTYVCEATNVVNDSMRTTDLTVYVAPIITFSAPVGGYVVNETDSVTFNCSVDGIPPPDIDWLRGGELVTNTSLSSRLTLSNASVSFNPGDLSNVIQTLTIRNAMDSDRGTYTCRATNDAQGGVASEEFQLFVQIPPTVYPVNNQSGFTANEGDVLTLSFVITRATPPVETDDIMWFYSRNFSSTPYTAEDITNLANRINGSTYMYSDDRLSLTISNIVQARRIDQPTDEGRYFLVAVNPAGVAFNYIDVVVNGPPVIVNTPTDQFEINNGSSATFVCNALAFPPHQISWSFTNASGVEMSNIISTDSNPENLKYQINMMNGTADFGTLTVWNVGYGDRGMYTCNATNEIGSVDASATLTVHVTPTIERTSNNTDVVINDPTYLVCLARGFPLPSIDWLKNGAKIVPYSDVSLNMRIDIFDFEALNDTDVSSGFMGSGTVQEFLDKIMSISRADIARLGELGVVSFLRFYDVIREDTANYSCVARNALPQTTRLMAVSNNVRLTVLESPDPPIDVEVVSFGARWVQLRWTISFNGNRPVNRVMISSNVSDFSVLNVTTAESTHNVTTGVLPFTNYTFVVTACNVIGCSDRSDMSDVVFTLNDTATRPLEVTPSVADGEEGQTNITVSWLEPAMPNGLISDYNITAVGTKSYLPDFEETKSVIFRISAATTGDRVQTALTGLTPGTLYSITVAAINGAGLGELSERVTATTRNADPIPPSEAPQPVMDTDDDNVRTVAVRFPAFDETNGLISHYQVAVVILPAGTDINDLPDPDIEFPNINGQAYDPSFCDRGFREPSVYVTAEFGRDALPSNGEFVIGKEGEPNDVSLYTNGLLCFAKSYTFFLRAYTAGDNSDTNQQRSVRQVSGRQYTMFTSTRYAAVSNIPASPSNLAPIIAGVVVGVLVVAIIIVIIIVVIVVVKHRSVKVYNPQDRSRHQFDFSSDSFKLTDYTNHSAMEDFQALPNHQPIPVASLAAHVDRMHLNENCGFSEEYKIIQERSAKHSVDACTAPDNKPRNRYANIQCYDHSRVHLIPVEGHEHDYINGNFIDGYNREKEYIATQGPLPDTVGDFWRLIWDYNIPSVVMLTNIMEKMKVKCNQYWPEDGSQQYANVNVTIINTIHQADFVIRHFQIKAVSSEEVREVRQYHFTSWPDFGVPRHSTPLLYFLRRIRNAHHYSNERPILVHCSAGVGRTGSLITIDVELQRARQKQVVDPFNYVLQMREKRNHMVQTEGQYVFLHDAILEGYTSGDTEIMVDKLPKRMTELEAVDDEGISGFAKEFNRLREFKVNVREFTDANDDANKFKNRITNALPYNYNRVHLKMSPGVGGSDYINASFIDGYAQKMTYIATQGPLKNTIEDFWKLIWEKESGVVVMLTQLEEKGKEQCAQYWPEAKNTPEKVGDQFTVELVSEGAFEDYICRELKITDITSAENKFHIVKQYHFISWPESGAPSSGAGMIDLIDQVIRTQQHTGNKPIVVHCSAGIGRTGAFCALSTAIERVKAEGIVDVFHTVKHLRTQRPHMVQTVEQYAFCYYAIKEYLESLSNYSNFDFNN